MPNKINKGYTFQTGELVTAAKLNNHVDNATVTIEEVDVKTISERPNFDVSGGDPATAYDELLIRDNTTNSLKKIAVGEFNMIPTDSRILDLTVRAIQVYNPLVPAEGNGNIWVQKKTEIGSNEWEGNANSFHQKGELIVNGDVDFNHWGALWLHRGNTERGSQFAAQDPNAQLLQGGAVRFNTDTNSIEVLDGSSGLPRWTNYKNRTAILYRTHETNNFIYQSSSNSDEVWKDIKFTKLQQSDTLLVNTEDFTPINTYYQDNDIVLEQGTYLIETSANFFLNNSTGGAFFSSKANLRLVDQNGIEVAVGEIVNMGGGGENTTCNLKAIVTAFVTTTYKLQYKIVRNGTFPYNISYIDGLGSSGLGESRMFQTKIMQLK